jgi:hypothetical protein
MHDVRAQITVSVNSLHHENLTTCEFSCVGNTRGGERAVGSEAYTVVGTKTIVSWGVCTQSSKGGRNILPVAYSFDLEAEAALLSKVGNCSRLCKVHHTVLHFMDWQLENSVLENSASLCHK